MENKTGKYLKYAIGEIVLVVIGILIALQINNANNNRLNKNELNSYLSKIADNIEQDIIEIEKLRLRREGVRLNAERSMKYLLNEDYSNMDNILSGGECFFEFYFTSNKSGYEALKNSEFIGSIQNPLIDTLLTNYYSIVTQIEKAETNYNNYIESMEIELTLSIEMIPTIKFLLAFVNRQEEFGINSNDPEWQSKNNKELIPYVTHNAFKAVVIRTIMDKSYRKLYQELKETGEALIKEVHTNKQNK